MNYSNCIERNAAIMFADICGSTTLYESLGDETAHHLISTYMKQVNLTITQNSGRVIKYIGDEVLAIFEQLKDAANCAIHIHQLSENKMFFPSLKMKVGIRFGSVFLESKDVFGDTVNTAARIVSMATPGQTLLGAEITGIKLKSGAIRSIGFHKLKGKQNAVEIYELLDSQPKGLITCAIPLQKNQRKKRILRLKFSNSEIEVSSGQKITIGRGAQNTLQIDHHLVSREHAELEGIRDRFVLRDISTNGLTILSGNGSEYILHREGITLIGSGIIYLGTQMISSSDVPIIYFVNTER